MNKKEFLKKQHSTFYSELLVWFNMQEKTENIEDNFVLCYQYPEGMFSITYGDLKKESTKELKKLQKKYGNNR